MARERDAAALWIPLIARYMEPRLDTLPPLQRRDADHFVLLWCRAQDSVRGQSQDHLREMARRLGADAHARRMFRSRSLRRRLVGTVALGHLQARDLAPSLQTEIASGPAVPSLVAAKALVRIDASIGVPCVLSIAAHREDWPLVGIFAQRGKNRPNRIGLTTCAILKVEGTRLHVRGLDAIDGTPVLDIKPVMREFLPRGEVRQPEWASELMAEYWTRAG